MESTEARDEIAAYVAEHRDELQDDLHRLSRTWKWFMANQTTLAKEYRGKWVALDDERVVAACKDREGLRVELLARGVSPAEVLRLPL
jgi:hypothetical protein